MPPIRRIGVLLAAGRGGRLGGTKQLKPWPTSAGTMPLVCAAYDAIRPVCDEMIVVLGHEADAVTAALGDRVFRRAYSNPDLPMFESIRAGLKAALRLDPEATVVLQPADHPQIRRTTLLSLCTIAERHQKMAVIPEYQGCGGHPVFIPAIIASHILATDCPDGLAKFWAEHPELSSRFIVADPFVVRDVDTPDDLRTHPDP